MQVKSLLFVIFLAIAAVVANASLYIVNEFERGVLLTLGRVSNADLQPGLHAKKPFFDQIRKFDARVLTLDARPERFLTAEKKSIMVDSYAKWRIVDVGKYYKATNGEVARAERLLAQRINEGLRNEFAQRTLQEVVSGERDELMSTLGKSLDGFTHDALGIQLVDVRVKRIDLPEEVSVPVFDRMAAEREREAREHRSKGDAEATKIRANADRQETIIKAKAYREAELLRGEGDAKAAGIYASAYNRNPEFYSFARSLKAYKSTFKGQEDIILLDPDSEFFKYLKDPEGK